MRRPVELAVTAAVALCVVLLFPGGGSRESEPSVALDAATPIEIARIELAEPSEPEPAALTPRTPAAKNEPAEPETEVVEPEVRVQSEPAALRPDPEVLARGDALLRAGAFPRLRATYIRIGFAAYREAVLELGGAFYLYDPRARRVLAEVDPRSGLLGAEGVREELSRWPRDVTRHLESSLALGRERYGARVSRVVLLPPASLDAALLGALDRHLGGLGVSSDALLRVDVAYELHGGRLYCEVLTVALRDGSERDLGLHIDLSTGERA